MDIISFFSVGSMLFILILFVLAIVSYFLSSISLMQMAQRESIDEAWLAWIPVGNLYIIGKLIKSFKFNGQIFEPAEYILPGFWLASMALSGVSFIGSLATLALSLVTFLSFHSLYKLYAPADVTKYMIMTVLLPGLGASIALFQIKDRSMVRI